MARPAAVYGLDIETDTSIDGLDPAVAPIITVALSSPGCDEIFSGDEPGLLFDLDLRIRDLDAGVIATWNGASFDLPFLAHRASLHGIGLGLRLRSDRQIGAYRAVWYRHRHIDAYRLYRGDVGPALRVSCGLKSIARLVGLSPIEVDRTKIHELEHEALHAYAASDARLARVLTERRWSTASRFVDRFAESSFGSSDAAIA